MKVTLKRYQVRLLDAIRAMEGRAEVVRDKDGNVIGTQVKPFEMTAKARYALARTAARITDEVRAIDLVKRRKILDDQDSKEDKNGQELSPACERELLELESADVEIEVHRVNITELKIETNQIGPSVLAGLDPILVGDL